MKDMFTARHPQRMKIREVVKVKRGKATPGISVEKEDQQAEEIRAFSRKIETHQRVSAKRARE